MGSAVAAERGGVARNKGISMKKKGAILNLGFVFFIFVFSVIFSVTALVYVMYQSKSYIDTEIERAVNIALQENIDDRYWANHISYVNRDDTRDSFYEYLYGINFNSGLEMYVSGKIVYKITAINLNINEGGTIDNPAFVEASGKVMVYPPVGFLPEFEFNFKEHSRAVRFDF